MQYGIDRGLTHRHGNLHDLVVAKAGFNRNPSRRVFGTVDGFERRIQCVRDPLVGHD
jgi:hypothetical protein